MKELGLLILRLGFGLSLLIFHGLPKLYHPHYNLVREIGLPFYQVWTWASILAESLFAVFVIIGFWTRFSSIIICINFLFALYLGLIIKHLDFHRTELPLLFLIAFISIALLGPGKYSIDKK
jgi:putative oxidoreductase